MLRLAFWSKTLNAQFIRLSKVWRDYIFKSLFYFTTYIILLLLAGCSIITNELRRTEDTTYLTPIPQATFLAYKEGSSIDNKLQAVIAARLKLESPHRKPYGTQIVLFAQELRLADAYKLVEQSAAYDYPDWVEDTKVWLVVFEGDIQVTFPNERMPNPPFHGCSYVIVKAETGPGLNEVASFDCSKAVKLRSK